MHYDDLTIQKLRELSILDVADKLGFRLTGFGDECRRAICPYHDDQHPSLHFSKRKGIFKCFVCGAKGDLFKLVMDTRCCTFVEACDWLVSEFHVVVIPPAPSVVPKSSVSSAQSVVSLPSDLVRRSLSLHSQFCQSVVSAGYLTDSQLRRAADRYRLGSTRDGGVIFPDTDLTGDTYRQWLAVVQQAAKCYPFRHPLRISRLLEDHASPDQKQRKIDLADFLFE